MWRRSGWLRQPSSLSRTNQRAIFNPVWIFKTRAQRASTVACFPEVRARTYSITRSYVPNILLPTACLILVCGNGHAALSASLQKPAGNGTDICHDSRYKSGGPAIPAYNYADNGDDWPGTCHSGKQQSPTDLPDRTSITLRKLPSDQLVRFGDVTASGNAVVRLGVQEVALFSSFWNVTGFYVPVCGAVDVGCLVSPVSSSVEYVDVSVMNLHFHANAEHTRTGSYYGAEAHLVTNVTANGTSHLVVFGVWMDINGDIPNDFFSQLQPFIDQTTGAGCNPVPDDTRFSVGGLLPADKEYYAYRQDPVPACNQASLGGIYTYLQCALLSVPDGTQTGNISEAQLNSLYRANAYTFQPCDNSATSKLCNIFGARTNNRVLQPLNGRTISIGSTPSA